METNKYNYDDLVSSAIEQKPLDFEKAFNDLIVGKLHSAIEDKKIQIAQQMYGYEKDDNYSEEE